MENKLDKLFRDKLVAHEEIPSMKAWDQIHDQLASKRKKVWNNRLAIAASIILLVGLGYVGFRSIDFFSVLETNMSSKSINPAAVEKKESINIQKNTLNENDRKAVDEVEKEHQNPVVAEVKTSKKSIENPSKPEPETLAQHVDVFDAPIPESEHETLGIENKQPDIAISNPNEDVDQPTKVPEELLAEYNQVMEPEKSMVNATVVKSYPQVKITYKAGKQSELLDSGRKTILEKGMDKITEFSDEHLLTAERKTKLRNTTEDVLALNFGKLINKSNREFEN